MYALTRLQADSGTWYWSVHFGRRGQSIYRRFYDPKHGGAANAKKAAIAWRNEQLAQHQALTMLEFCQQVRGNNTSGVAGVHFLKSADQPEGYWQAKLKIAGKAKHKSFSVKKHGAQQAYQMAVAAREQLLEQANLQEHLYLYDKLARQSAPGALPAKKKSAAARTRP